jgi:hypothetical protein
LRLIGRAAVLWSISLKGLGRSDAFRMVALAGASCF